MISMGKAKTFNEKSASIYCEYRRKSPGLSPRLRAEKLASGGLRYGTTYTCCSSIVKWNTADYFLAGLIISFGST